MSTGFKNHPKIKKLKMTLGCEAVLSFLFLLAVVAENKPETGEIPATETLDVALAADWDDNPDEFVETLVKLRLLDPIENKGWRIHDWTDHQVEIQAAIRRRERARHAALARWEREKERKREEARSRKSSAPSSTNYSYNDKSSLIKEESKKKEKKNNNICSESNDASPKGRKGVDDSERESSNNPPQGPQPEEVFVNLPLIPKDGEHPVTTSQVEEWGESYPALGVEGVQQELLKMREWLLSNPQKRKTKKGIRRFMTGWLGRAQDRAGARPGLFNSPGGGNGGGPNGKTAPGHEFNASPKDPMGTGKFSVAQVLAYWEHKLLGAKKPIDGLTKMLFDNIETAYHEWYRHLRKEGGKDHFHLWAVKHAQDSGDSKMKEMALKYMERIKKEGEPWKAAV